MKIHTEFQQNSLEWLVARSGVPTASEWDALVTPKWEIRKGDMPKSYLARKLAEWWLGGPLPGYNVLDMEFGKILEEEAIPWYEFTFSESVNRVGFVTDDAGFVGCSPDGLLGDDGGLELKCPEAHTHCGYLLAGGIPSQYQAQVQGSLYVTGRKFWRFVSYRRRFPPLVVTVEPDLGAQLAIHDALEQFLNRFQEAKARLVEMNGGPPLRAKTAEPYPEPENYDVPMP